MSGADEEQCARKQDSHCAISQSMQSVSLEQWKENRNEPITLFQVLSIQVGINVAGKRVPKAHCGTVLLNME